MKIGISSWAYGWAIGVEGYDKPASPLNAETLLDKAIELGVPLVQYADNLPATDAELVKASQYARSKGIEIELGVAGTDPDMLSGKIALSKDCGVSLLRTLPHCGGDIPSVKELTKRLKAVQPLLEKAGIVLAVENHDHYTSDELRQVMDDIHCRHIGICLDTANNYGKGESYRETASALLPYIVNFHVKDFIVKRVPHLTGFTITGAPAGKGLLDLRYFADRLSSSVHWVLEQWTPWQDTIENTIALEDEWAKTSIAYLKHLYA